MPLTSAHTRTRAHSYARTHTQPHAYIHTRTHTHTHARTHAPRGKEQISILLKGHVLYEYQTNTKCKFTYIQIVTQKNKQSDSMLS